MNGCMNNKSSCCDHTSHLKVQMGGRKQIAEETHCNSHLNDRMGFLAGFGQDVGLTADVDHWGQGLAGCYENEGGGGSCDPLQSERGRGVGQSNPHLNHRPHHLPEVSVSQIPFPGLRWFEPRRVTEMTGSWMSLAEWPKRKVCDPNNRLAKRPPSGVRGSIELKNNHWIESN